MNIFSKMMVTNNLELKAFFEPNTGYIEPNTGYFKANYH